MKTYPTLVECGFCHKQDTINIPLMGYATRDYLIKELTEAIAEEEELGLPEIFNMGLEQPRFVTPEENNMLLLENGYETLKKLKESKANETNRTIQSNR